MAIGSPNRLFKQTKKSLQRLRRGVPDPPPPPKAASPETHPTRAEPPRRVGGVASFFREAKFLGKDFPTFRIDLEGKLSVCNVSDVCPLNSRPIACFSVFVIATNPPF